MASFNGIPVIVSVNAVAPKVFTVQRLWFDRLFSWPWQPWQATHQETVYEPAIFHVGGGLDDGLPTTPKIVMHPERYRQLKQLIDETH